MIAILMGTAFVVGGVWGILQWFPDFLVVVRGFIPLSMLLGGVVAVMAGFNSIQKRRNEKPKS